MGSIDVQEAPEIHLQTQVPANEPQNMLLEMDPIADRRLILVNFAKLRRLFVYGIPRRDVKRILF